MAVTSRWLSGHGAVAGDLPRDCAAMSDSRSPAVPDVAIMFREHGAAVHRWLIRLGLNPSAAEDATQEVFIVAHRRHRDYREQGTVKAWLFAIARRIASRHHRTRGRTLDKLAQVELPGGAVEPERQVALREAAAATRRFIESLPIEQQTVLWLADLEGMSVPEISTTLGVKANTVYSRLRLARGKFRRFAAAYRADEEGRGG